MRNWLLLVIKIFANNVSFKFQILRLIFLSEILEEWWGIIPAKKSVIKYIALRKETFQNLTEHLQNLAKIQFNTISKSGVPFSLFLSFPKYISHFVPHKTLNLKLSNIEW